MFDNNLAQATDLFRKTAQSFTGHKFFYETSDSIQRYPVGFVQLISSEPLSLPSKEYDDNENQIISTINTASVQVTFITKQGRSAKEKIDSKNLAFKTISLLMNGYPTEQFKYLWENERSNTYPNLKASIMRAGDSIRNLTDTNPTGYL